MSEPLPTQSSANGSMAASAESAKDTAFSGESGTIMTLTHHPAAQSAATTISNTASSTLSSIQNSETYKQVANGPVAGNVKNEAAKTSNEFSNLANSRTMPSQKAANGQALTHYHSFFYNLLSWQNPRATAIAFAGSVVFIFAARYVNLLHYFFKFTSITLGVTASIELAGKLIFSNGVAAQLRPRRYYTIPREFLEASLEDAEQLLNFFVIETQRIVFVENVYVTIAAFVGALISYGLIKILPFWGLVLTTDIVLYTAPLVYVSNREAIDSFLEHTTKVVNSQVGQIKGLTAQHTERATETIKAKAGEYSSKAQEYMGTNRSGNMPSTSIKTEPLDSKLPSAPQTEPKTMAQTSAPPLSTEQPLMS